jgi:hypothetical protein
MPADPHPPIAASALKSLKLLGCLLCLAIVASNFWSMSRWSERRGVVDDLCYLRQAHLFQQRGFAGLNTDIALETDGYFQRLVTEAGHPEWRTAGFAMCHPPTAAGRLVIQYPPGVGFLLAPFPEGHQVVPFYTAATLLVLLMALAAIGLARSRAAILAAAGFGALALYFMINPAKASYSIAPTMVVCAAAGFLTARLFRTGEERSRLWTTALIGLLLGLSVNFRIPNLLLSAGYAAFFLIAFLLARDWCTFLRGALFGLGSVAGLVPTLIYNAINAGSPFATTYGSGDVVPPDLSFSIVGEYLRDLQGLLIIATLMWIGVLLVRYRTRELWPVAAIVALNLAVNLGYFLSHPIYTQYYLMPLAMLSLWSLLFAYVMDDRVDPLLVPDALQRSYAAAQSRDRSTRHRP